MDFRFLEETTHSSETDHTSHESSETSHSDSDHEDDDFGIGTLVLAMAFGTLSRMYITHMTG